MAKCVKTTAFCLLMGGWVAIELMAKDYAALGRTYWILGGLALSLSIVGGLMLAWAERRWPSPERPQKKPGLIETVLAYYRR